MKQLYIDKLIIALENFLNKKGIKLSIPKDFTNNFQSLEEIKQNKIKGFKLDYTSKESFKFIDFLLKKINSNEIRLNFIELNVEEAKLNWWYKLSDSNNLSELPSKFINSINEELNFIGRFIHLPESLKQADTDFIISDLNKIETSIHSINFDNLLLLDAILKNIKEDRIRLELININLSDTDLALLDKLSDF